ncbi:hypothetical protein KORDIASMS9_01537 [Kordia sp. SMS9]|uniref:hypothetical protein n=1 Tax=Kordia sp. SMS9 TaxID=2282170 RepID=UPI000E0DF5E9|nr:hypothetical protein [Kordia sp. SMS9]AXG69317.1 hypothetical protein KORDIASMS9_01537 [Kordia sp. SMS9]
MLSFSFHKLSPAAEKKLLLLAIATFVLAGSCMVHFDTLLKNEFAPLGIISFELANTLENSTQILNSWETTDGAMQSTEWSLWFDYIFIVTYVFLLCLLIHRVRRTVWKNQASLAYRFGIVMMRMVLYAGIMDMVENFALLQLFYGDLQTHWATLAFVMALLKFIHLALGILYVLIGLLTAGIKKLA